MIVQYILISTDPFMVNTPMIGLDGVANIQGFLNLNL